MNSINLTFGASLGGGTKTVFASLAKGLQQIAKGLKAAAVEQVKLGKVDVATSLNSTAKAVTKLTKELKASSTQSKKFVSDSKKITTFGSTLQKMFSSLSKSLQTYSRYMVASNVVRGFISGAGTAKNAVIEYDQAMQDLKAITLATEAETLVLGEALIKVASATKFSMGEVGTGMKKLAQAGFSATEVSEMIGNIAELATGSLESMDVTVGLVSTAIRVFNKEVSQTSEVVDIFSNAVNKSRLTISGLNTTFNHIGPLAAATGLSLKDTSASMMLLANSGIKFSTIGTGLRRLLGGLSKPTGEFKTAILAAGFSLADFNPNISDFRDILKKLPVVVKNSTDAIKFFGYRGSSVISAFTTQGIEEYDRLRGAVDRVGTTSEMAVTQMEGLQNAIKNVKDRFGVLSKTLAEGGFLTIFKMIVDSIRKLLSLFIAIAGNPIGQTIIAMLSLASAVVVATAAFVAFTKISIGAIFTGWISAFVGVTSSITGVGIASFGASSGVITLTSALKGLIVSLWSFITTPIGGTIVAITTLFTLFFFSIKRGEKNLKDLIIKEEKYSSSLEKTMSRLDSYKKAVTEQGENSKEAREKVVQLKETVSTLGKEYDQISKPLSEFTKRVDENTGSILGSSSTIKELSNVLSQEYEQSILKGIAAKEKLILATKKSISWLERESERLKLKSAFWEKWGGKLRNIGNSIGMSFSGDLLNAKGIEQGTKALEYLQQKADDSDTKAAAQLKNLKNSGEQLVKVLLKRYTTVEKLKGMTDEQLTSEILLVKKLTMAHKGAAAAAFKILQDKRDAEEIVLSGKDKEIKRMEEAIETYALFGLTLDGVSKKLKAQMNSFDRLMEVKGKDIETNKDLAVSGENLLNAFKKVGVEVKTASDFLEYTKAVKKLQDSNRLTKEDLLELEKITRKVFSGIRSSASDLESAFSEKMRLLDIEEQKQNADEWKAYIVNLENEGEVTEKTHQKRLEKIHLDSLEKRLYHATLYFNSLKKKYADNTDAFQYQQGMIAKAEAEQVFLQAKAAYLRPDTSGSSGKGETFAQKIAKKEFENAQERQIQAAKTMNAELKASYKTRAIDIHTFYEKQRKDEEENTAKQRKLLEDRIAEIKKSYNERYALETEANRKSEILTELKMKELTLKKELNKVNEEGIQILYDLDGAEAKELETMRAKVASLLEEQLKNTEQSRSDLPDANKEDQYTTEIEQLKRAHAIKREELEKMGIFDLDLAKLIALQKEEIRNKEIAAEKASFDLRISAAQEFASDMSSAMSSMAESGLGESKKFFAAYKAFAVAEASISTFSSAQAAYDKGMKMPGVPYPVAVGLAVAGAAGAIVAGFARIAQIKSQKAPGFKEGGLVHGPGGPRGDKVNVNLSDREFVQPEDSVSYYGVDVMEGLRKKVIPKVLFEGYSKKTVPKGISRNLADGGSVSNVLVQKNDSKRPINIVNTINPGTMVSSGLNTPEGKNAFINNMAEMSETIKKVLF